jgi:hypothetical protein
MDIGKTVLSPCKDCTERWIDLETLQRCHSSCSKYLAYKEELEAHRAIQNKENKENEISFISRQEWSKNKRRIRQEQIKKKRYRTI